MTTSSFLSFNNVQRALLLDGMKRSLEETAYYTRGNEVVLGNLDTFLLKRGLDLNRVSCARSSSPLKGDEGAFLSHLQQLITEWAQALPLDATVEHKGGQWSVPAMLVRELFSGLSELLLPVSLLSTETRSVAIWMTLLLNGVWHAATPALRTTWMEGRGSDASDGKRPMTRPWLFWGTRFLACMAQQDKGAPVLELPSEVGRLDTQEASLILHTYRDAKTQHLEAFKKELWTRDSVLHPLLWNTSSLFTAQQFETLWVPHLLSQDTFLPKSLKLPMAIALCHVLETAPDTLTVEAVQVACLFLFDTFPVTTAMPSAATGFEYAPTLRHDLFKAVERWMAHHPEAHTSAWCELPLGAPKDRARWRAFWEQRFLEHTFTSQVSDGVEEKSASFLRARRRV